MGLFLSGGIHPSHFYYWNLEDFSLQSNNHTVMCAQLFILYYLFLYILISFLFFRGAVEGGTRLVTPVMIQLCYILRWMMNQLRIMWFGN